MKVILSYAFVALLIVSSSCRNSERDLDNSTGSSESAWIAMNHFHNIMREVHRVAQVDSVLNAIPTADALVPTVCVDSIKRIADLGPFPIDLTLFYSISNTCVDQRNRGGQIRANFDGLYSDVGTTIKISLENYEVDNTFISGDISMTVTRSSTDSLYFDVVVENGSILDMDKPGKNQSYFNAQLNYINYSGRKTFPTTDDDFAITGTGEGIAENGVIYAYEVENELVLTNECEHERYGSFRLSAPNTQDRVVTLNEGDACDKLMQVAIYPANGHQIVEIK